MTFSSAPARKFIQVLLVEDNLSDALLTKSYLWEFNKAHPHLPGFQVTHSTCFAEAPIALLDHPIDVILLDFFLPDSQGLETIARMRGLTASIPVIILTDLKDVGKALESIRAGAQDYLVKEEINGALLSRAIFYALERQELLAQVQDNFLLVDTLRRIDQAIASNFDSKVTLNLLVNEYKKLIGSDTLALLLFDPARQSLEYVIGAGEQYDSIKALAKRAGNELAEQCFHNLEPVITREPFGTADSAFGQALVKKKIGMYAANPIISKGKPIGVLELFFRQGQIDLDRSLHFLSAMAAQAAIAIENAQTFYDLQKANLDLSQAYESVLESWALSLEQRGLESPGHTQRVIGLALELGRAAGVRDEELPHLRRGALLHDIGMLFFPDCFLQKAGALTADESALLHQHPQFAYDALYKIAYLRPALEIPLYHHERWDGSGYPFGLKGSEIPLFARIFAIVDVWDALLSQRPHRPAWEQKDVLQYFRDQKGILFDPHLTETWLRMLSANPDVAATARYTAAAPGEASGDKNQATAKMSLLIVDDEEAITASLARSLRHEYTIYTANSGAQALEILAHEQICMILTDQRMPGISGVELLEQARKLSPHSLGLLISGYSDPDALLKAINLGTVQGFIQKPWNIQDLRLRLAELAEHYRMNNHPAA